MSKTKTLDEILNEYMRREEPQALLPRTGEWQEVTPGHWQYVWHNEAGQKADSPYAPENCSPPPIKPKAGDFVAPSEEPKNGCNKPDAGSSNNQEFLEHMYDCFGWKKK